VGGRPGHMVEVVGGIADSQSDRGGIWINGTFENYSFEGEGLAILWEDRLHKNYKGIHRNIRGSNRVSLWELGCLMENNRRAGKGQPQKGAL